jgi:hypothetical protein
MIGSAESGHDFVQNMYGMYIRFDQGIVSEETNLGIAATAFDHIYKPLLVSSLGHMTPDAPDNIPASSIQSGIESGDITNAQLLKITRDYKDTLVTVWKTHAPNDSWKEFEASALGLQSIFEFEKDSAKFTYAVEISYEELIDSPHRVFTAIVDYLLPRQDNPEHEQFGAAKRKIDQNIIDKVIHLSGLRSRREGQHEELLSSVGIHKQFLSPEEIDEVNDFIVSL